MLNFSVVFDQDQAVTGAGGVFRKKFQKIRVSLANHRRFIINTCSIDSHVTAIFKLNCIIGDTDKFMIISRSVS